MAPTAWGTFHLFLNFSTPRAIRAVQIFVLKFSKNGTDLGDEFGVANQLQGGVGLSSGQVSQGYCQFQSNFQWLPEIGN